jgi:hypothetical protein
MRALLSSSSSRPVSQLTGQPKAIVVYGVWHARWHEAGTLVTLYESLADAHGHSDRWHSVGHRTGDKLWITEHALHLDVPDGDSE